MHKIFFDNQGDVTILFGSTVVIGGASAQTVDDVLKADAKRLQLAGISRANQ